MQYFYFINQVFYLNLLLIMVKLNNSKTYAIPTTVTPRTNDNLQNNYPDKEEEKDCNCGP